MESLFPEMSAAPPWQPQDGAASARAAPSRDPRGDPDHDHDRGRRDNGIGSHVFKGVEYLIRVTVDGSALLLSVEERYTCEVWRGEFDAVYLEELSRKTGNFKSFLVFARMLYAAASKTNESVRLDLLTYADLEALRRQKGGGLNASTTTSGSASQAASSKRYLIMTFTSEFDKIHYPLPLVYNGKPDSAQLQAVIRDLHKSLAAAQSQAAASAGTLAQVQGRYESACNASIDQQTAINSLQQQLVDSHSSVAQFTGSAGASPNRSQRAISRKDLAILKKIITKLESDLITERTKFQRQLQKKQSQVQQLQAENEDLRDSERSLQIRCRNLTGESAIRRAGRTRKPKVLEPRRSASAERRSMTRSSERLSRGERPQVRLSGRAYSRSPSPARFDPTEYVRAREEKLQAARQARETERRRDSRGRSTSPRGNLAGGRGRSPATRGISPAERLLTKPRSRSNSSSRQPHTASSNRSHSDGKPSTRGARSRSNSADRRVAKPSPSNGAAAAAAAAVAAAKTTNTASQIAAVALGPTPADVPSKYFQRNAEITDIDARLEALQQFLHTAQAAS